MSSAQLSEGKQVEANCRNSFKHGENSMAADDISIDHDHEQDQRHSGRPKVDTDLLSDDKKAVVELGSDMKRTRLQKTQEAKAEANNQSLRNHANESLTAQALSTAGVDAGIPIPDSRTKKYWPFEVLRHPSLLAVEINRYKEGVIGRLKEAVDDHKILQHRAQFIDYKAGMVGRAPNESCASILLFCHEKDQRHLKKLLDPGFLTRMNCCSPYRPKFLSWASVPNDPTFWIYIFPSFNNPTNRYAGPEPVVISFHAGSMPGFCGALVEHQRRVATVGLAVEVDGIARLLTVDHIFNDEACENHSSEGNSDDESSYYYDSDDEDDDTSFEVASDSSQNESRLRPTSNFHNKNQEASPKSNTSSEAPLPIDIQTHISDAGHQTAGQENDTANSCVRSSMDSKTLAHKVQCPTELPHDYAYLDWACLELDDKTVEGQPGDYLSGPDGSRILLKKIGDVPSSHATSVFMISGINGVRSGKILADSFYLGALPGQQMCKAWTLVFDSLTGLVPGECGSVVIDQHTHEVYGQVIGSNVLGHAHMVSSQEVLGQIKHAFSTDSVSFPCKFLPPSPRLLSSDKDVLIQNPLPRSQLGDTTSLETNASNHSNSHLPSQEMASSHVANSQSFPSQETLVFSQIPTNLRFLQAIGQVDRQRREAHQQQRQRLQRYQRSQRPTLYQQHQQHQQQRQQVLQAQLLQRQRMQLVQLQRQVEQVEQQSLGHPLSPHNSSRYITNTMPGARDPARIPVGSIQFDSRSLHPASRPVGSHQAHTDPVEEEEGLTSKESSLMTPPTSYERPGSTAVKRSRSPTDDETDQEKKRTKRSRSHHSSNAALQSTEQTGFTSGQRQR